MGRKESNQTKPKNIHLYYANLVQIAVRGLTLKAPMATAADYKFCNSFPKFWKNKVRYFMRIVCQQTILMKYHALFLKKQQNLKLSSAANYTWRFMG